MMSDNEKGLVRGRLKVRLYVSLERKYSYGRYEADRASDRYGATRANVEAERELHRGIIGLITNACTN
jgi:hypothetical protein